MPGNNTSPVQYDPADGAPAPQPALATGEGPTRDISQITIEEVIRPLGIATMLTCLAISLSQLVATFSDAWPGTVFAAVTFLISLESIHAQRLLWRRHLSSGDAFRFRFVEWVMILVLLRFSVYLYYGLARLMADVSSWTANIATFFDAVFLISTLLMIGFWVLALTLSRAMQELETSTAEKMPSITDPNHYLRATMPHHGITDRQARLNQIVTIFFWGGAALLILSGFARVNLRELVTLSHARSPGIILNVFAYFLIGFLLISQAQYTILRANWELQNIPILGRLGRRWLWLVVGFLLLIGLIASLLPVSYSVGILDALSTALQWIAYVVLQVVFTIFFIISYLLSLIMNLFRGNTSTPPEPTRQPVPTPPPPMAVAHEPWPWWALVRSLIFWGILTGVVGYSLYHFIGDRWGIFRGLKAGRFFAWLGRIWKGLRRGARRAVAALSKELATRRAARQARIQAGLRRYFSLGRLAPRERVRYFYLATLRRTGQQGFGRRGAQTPLEYQEVLQREMPDDAEQVHALTQAFVTARYSERSINKEDARSIQEVWKRIKRALLTRKRALKGPPK